MISNIQFLILTQLQPAPAPPETDAPVTPDTPGPTTLCQVTTYVNSEQECVRGVGVTTYLTLSACCLDKGPAGGQCCDPCDLNDCENGPPVPTPPPITVRSCVLSHCFNCNCIDMSVLLNTTILLFIDMQKEPTPSPTNPVTSSPIVVC